MYMMESTQLYRVVRSWLMANVEGDEGTVVSMAICSIDEDIKREVAKYGWGEDEARGTQYKAEGATHLVRFLVAGQADLVDGDDWYFRIEGDGVVLINEPDRPAYCGGYLDEGMTWVAERSLKLSTSLDRE